MNQLCFGKTIYNFISEINTGTEGVVYKCITNNGIQYAMKVYNTELSKNKFMRISKLQLNEIVSTIKNLTHESIIKTYKVFIYKDIYYELMEYIAGDDMEVNFNKFTVKERMYLLNGIINAVGYLHSLDIAHRDLKRENFVYCPRTNILKLIDFSHCSLYNSVHDLVGTIEYMAPELFIYIFKNSKDNKPQDIWALGINIFEFLLEISPWPCANLLNNNINYKYYLRYNKFINYQPDKNINSFEHLIKSMLCINIHERINIYQSIEEYQKCLALLE